MLWRHGGRSSLGDADSLPPVWLCHVCSLAVQIPSSSIPILLCSPLYVCKNRCHYVCDFVGQKRWNSVSNLVILLRSITLKEVIVWERLKPSRLSYCEAATLSWVRVNEVVAVFGDVAGYGRTRCIV
jgi:hypothetical protein